MGRHGRKLHRPGFGIQEIVINIMLHTSDFDFELPPELIASRPLQQRDASRMLVVRGGELADKHIRDFVDYLQPGDVVVFNN